jgi:diguanylate cyclase (GGDEF)-like protein
MLAICALATGAATALATWGAPHLPIIVNGDDYRALTGSFVGPFALLLTSGALVALVWRTRCATTVELFLAVSLALLILDDVPTLVGGSRLSVGWYFGRLEAAISAAMLLGFYIADADRRFAAVSTLATNLATERTVLDRMVTEQCHANEALGLLARQDGLTGLANRRRLDEIIEQEWMRARREQQSLGLLMIDVDHFKLYNDRYGHQAGDTCLRTIAFLLRDIARRPADLAARYGGEEFMLLLPNTDLQGAGAIAEAFSAALRWKHIPHDRAPFRRVTVSIGVAAIIPPADSDDFEALVKAADQALYRAKNAGRDKAMAPGMDS